MESNREFPIMLLKPDAFYTGVGARRISIVASEVMRLVANRLATLGLILRSGGAEGSDTIALPGFYVKDALKMDDPEAFLFPILILGWGRVEKIMVSEFSAKLLEEDGRIDMTKVIVNRKV